ncbi:MAG TPA: hypothetical protein VMZ28_23915 [Kofleriaceae bacterium]|nr:hypothetical protein [Kofleriaceae bacterium]
MTARRVTSLLSVAVVLAAGAASAAADSPGGSDKGVFGLGIIAGEPTGVSGKYYLGNDTAIDGALGAAFLGRGIQVHADFLWHPIVIDQKESFVLPLYFGVGARVLRHDSGGGDDVDHTRIGLRVPVGILFDFTEIPIDVFGEVAGVADYRTAGDDDFALDINLGVGARYYF